MNIRFYDNEETNWENDMSIFKDQIEFIHVNEYEPNILISSIDAPPLDSSSLETKLATISERNRLFISGYIDYWVRQNNTYALYLKEIITSNPVASNEILKQDAWEGVLRIGYPNNGLNIDDLLVWSSSSSDKLILSDWDRTITVVEGMYFGPIDGTLTSKVESGEIIMHDLLVYLMGGEERLAKVIDMFSILNENSVQIFILTHNRNASKNKWPKNRELYVKILQEIIPFKSIEDIDAILFSSADYITMKSIKELDSPNSYRKYKSTCSIDIVKDIVKQCGRYIITGGKRKMYGKRKNKRVTRRKRNKRVTKNRNKKGTSTRKYK
jgi:hypothetical protein